MALTDIIAKIEKEADRKIALMEQFVQDELKKIAKEEEDEIKTRQADLEAKGRATGEGILRKAKTLADLEAANALLRAKREVIDSVYETVAREAATLNAGEYTKLLVSLLKEIASDQVTGTAHPAPGREKETEKALREAGLPLKMGAPERGIAGGLLIKDSKVEYDLSFENLFGRLIRRCTELETAKHLFG